MCGCEATWRIVAGAHHSFDRATPVEMIAEASVARVAPTIYLDDDDTSIHPVQGHMPPNTTERDLMLHGIKAAYGVKGAHLGTDHDYAEVFHTDMVAFWQACFS